MKGGRLPSVKKMKDFTENCDYDIHSIIINYHCSYHQARLLLALRKRAPETLNDFHKGFLQAMEKRKKWHKK